jgi:predicted transcriptional regulator
VSLTQLVQAAEELRHEAETAGVEKNAARSELLKLRDQLGGRNKLARRLDVSGPYLGRVLRGEKPITSRLIAKIGQLTQSEEEPGITSSAQTISESENSHVSDPTG